MARCFPRSLFNTLCQKDAETAHRPGIHFVFATGRHYVDVGQIRDNLAIKSYMITSNGACVHNSEGDLIFAHHLDSDIAADLFAIVYHDPLIFTNVYREEQWYINRPRPQELDFFKEAVFNYQLFSPADLEPQQVSKVFLSVKIINICWLWKRKSMPVGARV